MKMALAIGVLIGSLCGCAIVSVDYGYRGGPYDRGEGYSHRGHYRGDVFPNRGDRYDRHYGYQDHGQ